MESDMCCVCEVHLNQKQKRIVLEQTTNIISLICEWIAPRIISENDYICQFCYKSIVQAFKDSEAKKKKDTNVGLEMEVFVDTEQSPNGRCSKTANRNVCLMCDTSLSNRQKLPNIKLAPTELEQLMLNIISEAPDIKIGSEVRVCSKCWCKVEQSAINLQEVNAFKPIGIRDDQSVEIKSEAGSDQEHSEHLMENEIEVDQPELIKSEPEDLDDDSQIDEINVNSDFPRKRRVSDNKKQKHFKI